MRASPMSWSLGSTLAKALGHPPPGLFNALIRARPRGRDTLNPRSAGRWGCITWAYLTHKSQQGLLIRGWSVRTSEADPYWE